MDNSSATVPASGSVAASWRQLVRPLMVLPALAFLLVFLVLPSLTLFSYSVQTQAGDGSIGLPLTLGNFQHLLFTPAYQQTVLLTLRVSLWTSAISVLLAYPLAMAVAYGNRIMSSITLVLVVMPLVVSVIVRTYGWELLLGNSATGVVNSILATLGAPPALLHVMFTEWAVIIASVHVFLPLMVLPIAASLGRINPSLSEAARMLGAPGWRAFLDITLPLSMPGLMAGLTIVFSLTASSYVTPTILGGTRGAMLGNLLEQQVTTTYDWAMAAAIATVMVAITLAANVGVTWLLEHRQTVRRLASGAR